MTKTSNRAKYRGPNWYKL